jgi:hypothetical protein
MRSRMSKIAILAALCLALIAAAKFIKVEIFVYDPDDDNNYVTNIELTVTAYDQNNKQVAMEQPDAWPTGPNAHARFTVPAESSYLMVDVYDVDDECTETFGPLPLGGRAHVGGHGFFLRLDGCTKGAPTR